MGSRVNSDVDRIKHILFDPPQDYGFRFGVVALFLTIITIGFPVFAGIADWSPTLQVFINILYGGLIGTVLMAFLLWQMKGKHRIGEEDMIVLTAQSSMKQALVVGVGIVVGIIALLVNVSAGFAARNILMGSTAGFIDPQSFYFGLLAGVGEELLFRGFFQTFIEVALGGTLFARLFAVAPSSLIFAWFHYAAYPNNLIAFWALLAIGVVFGLAQALIDDIGVPMIAHIINNTFANLESVLLAASGWIIPIIFIAFLAFMAAAAGTYRRRNR